jgi:hypothetical protein
MRNRGQLALYCDEDHNLAANVPTDPLLDEAGLVLFVIFVTRSQKS